MRVPAIDRVLRPRVFVYGGILLAATVAFGVGIATRSPFTVEALRDRNALYRTTADGIENGYTLKIANKREQARRFEVKLVAKNAALALRDTPAITVPAGEVASVPVAVHAPETVAGRQDVRFEVRAIDGGERHVADAESTFFGPVPGR